MFKKIIFFLLPFLLLGLTSVRKVKAGCDPGYYECGKVCDGWISGGCCSASGGFHCNCCVGDRIWKVDVVFCNPTGEMCSYQSCTNCSGDCNSCGGCFTPDTQVDTPFGGEEIGKIEVGDEVTSGDPETGEETTSVVEKIYEATRAAYYK